jgi:hypothetical protein
MGLEVDDDHQTSAARSGGVQPPRA